MGQWAILSWNTIDDIGLVMGTDSCGEAEPTPAVFDTEEEAETYAQTECAWNYKLVDLSTRLR